MPSITEPFLRSRRSRPTKGEPQKRIIDGDLMVKIGRGGAVTFFTAPTRDGSGKQRIEKIGRWDHGMQLPEARKRATLLRTKIRGDANPNAPEVSRTGTFEEAFELAMQWKLETTSEKNVQRYRDCWIHLRHLAEKPIRLVKRDDIKLVYDTLIEAEKFKTANVTKRAASFALLKGHNAALVFEPIKDDTRGERHHEGRIRTAAQWNNVISLARGFSNQNEGNAVVAQAIWGARYNEVRHLRWEWVDEDSGVIVVPSIHTKNKKLDLHLPIIDLIPTLLKEQRGKSEDWLFPMATDPGSPTPHAKNFWKRARIILKRSVSAHDLRHAWKTAAVEAGVDEQLRDRMQDHAIRKSSGGYYTPSAEMLKTTGNKVVAKLRGE